MFQKLTIMLYHSRVDKMFPGQKYVKYCQNPHIWLYPKGGSFTKWSWTKKCQPGSYVQMQLQTRQNNATSLRNIISDLSSILILLNCISVKYISLRDACFKNFKMYFWIIEIINPNTFLQSKKYQNQHLKATKCIWIKTSNSQKQ